MALKERQFLGLCVGRETGGVDCALAGVTGHGDNTKVRQIAYLHVPLDAKLAGRLIDADAGFAGPRLVSGPAWLAAEPELTDAMGMAATAFLAKANAQRENIAGVGLLGHLLINNGIGRGVHVAELGSGGALARSLSMPLVADLARSAIAPDGSMAALAWPTWLILQGGRLSRVLVHLGAVTTLTFVPADSVATDTVSFDAAPGTALLDELAIRMTGKADPDGTLSAKAHPCAEMLNELLANPYFHARPPKLAGSGQWAAAYADRMMLVARKNRCDADAGAVLATAVELIARAAAMAIANLTERPHEVVLGGRGAMNIHLGTRIRTLLSPSSTYPSQKYGVAAEVWQAMATAVLAAIRLDEFALPTHDAAGGWRQSVVGGLYLP